MNFGYGYLVIQITAFKIWLNLKEELIDLTEKLCSKNIQQKFLLILEFPGNLGSINFKFELVVSLILRWIVRFC